jgi:hypothetical protein
MPSEILWEKMGNHQKKCHHVKTKDNKIGKVALICEALVFENDKSSSI